MGHQFVISSTSEKECQTLGSREERLGGLCEGKEAGEELVFLIC